MKQTRLYCTCGAHITVNSFVGVDSSALARFRAQHQGQNHKPCNAKTAAAARASKQLCQTEFFAAPTHNPPV